MGEHIVKGSNGNYSVWSSIVDAIIIEDATEAELVKYYGKRAKRAAEDDIRRRIKKVNENPDEAFRRCAKAISKLCRQDDDAILGR